MFSVGLAVWGESVLLRCNYKPGEVQVYDVTMKVKVNASVLQGKRRESTTMDMKMDMGVAITCISVEENEFTAEIRFYSMKAEIEASAMGTQVRMIMDPSGIKTYQGDKLVKSITWSDFKDPSMPNMGALLDTRIRCRFARNGELLEVYDQGIFAGKLPGFEFDRIVGGQVVFPSEPISVGESWEGSTETSVGGGLGGDMDIGGLENSFKYTLKELGTYKGRRCAVIDVKGSSKLKEENPGLSFKQKVTGMTIIEIDTGKIMLAKGEAVQTMDGEMGGVDIRMDATAAVKLTYGGSEIPGEAVAQTVLSAVDPKLLQAIYELRVPIVLEDKVKIGDRFYSVKDVVVVNGTELRLLKFTSDRIYLEDDSMGIVYKIAVNFRGEVAGIKPLTRKRN